MLLGTVYLCWKASSFNSVIAKVLLMVVVAPKSKQVNRQSDLCSLIDYDTGLGIADAFSIKAPVEADF